MTGRSTAAGVVLAVGAALGAALLANGCSSGPQCWRVGYEKSGITQEQGSADLAAAMQDAEQRFPSPVVVGSSSAQASVHNQVALRRVEHVRATMEARGYQQVRIPVDCETGASLAEEP
jgi:hypothetical protein